MSSFVIGGVTGGGTSAYQGFHLGGGYVWEITDKASLDFYGKYFWTRQAGDSVTLSTGDPVEFDDVYSMGILIADLMPLSVIRSDFLTVKHSATVSTCFIILYLLS